MRNKTTNRILSFVVAILFLANNLAYGLGTMPLSARPEDQGEVRALATKRLAEIRGNSPLTPVFDAPFVDETGVEITGVDIVKTDYSHPPKEWGANNPILGMTDLVDAFKHFVKHEALAPYDFPIEIRKGTVDVRKGELPVSTYKEVRRGGRVIKYILVIDEGFIKAWNDIRKNDIWFTYTIPTGEKRIVSVAWGIFYWIAKHELTDSDFLTKGPKAGSFGGHITAIPGFEPRMNPDEVLTNFIGGNYAIPNEAIKLWFLASYCGAKDKQWSNAALRRQMKWFLNKESQDERPKGGGEPYKLYELFPALINDPNARIRAFDLACFINLAYFSRPGVEAVDFSRRAAQIEKAPSGAEIGVTPEDVPALREEIDVVEGSVRHLTEVDAELRSELGKVNITQAVKADLKMAYESLSPAEQGLINSIADDIGGNVGHHQLVKWVLAGARLGNKWVQTKEAVAALLVIDLSTAEIVYRDAHGKVTVAAVEDNNLEAESRIEPMEAGIPADESGIGLIAAQSAAEIANPAAPAGPAALAEPRPGLWARRVRDMQPSDRSPNYFKVGDQLVVDMRSKHGFGATATPFTKAVVAKVLPETNQIDVEPVSPDGILTGFLGCYEITGPDVWKWDSKIEPFVPEGKILRREVSIEVLGLNGDLEARLMFGDRENRSSIETIEKLEHALKHPLTDDFYRRYIKDELAEIEQALERYHKERNSASSVAQSIKVLSLSAEANPADKQGLGGKGHQPGVPKARTARAAFDRAVPATGTLEEAMRGLAPVRAGLTRGSATKAFLPEERDLGRVAAAAQPTVPAGPAEEVSATTVITHKLSCSEGRSIMIGDDVTLQLKKKRQKRAEIFITAPRNMTAARGEIFDTVRRNRDREKNAASEKGLSHFVALRKEGETIKFLIGGDVVTVHVLFMKQGVRFEVDAPAYIQVDSEEMRLGQLKGTQAPRSVLEAEHAVEPRNRIGRAGLPAPESIVPAAVAEIVPSPAQAFAANADTGDASYNILGKDDTLTLEGSLYNLVLVKIPNPTAVVVYFIDRLTGKRPDVWGYRDEITILEGQAIITPDGTHRITLFGISDKGDHTFFNIVPIAATPQRQETPAERVARISKEDLEAFRREIAAIDELLDTAIKERDNLKPVGPRDDNYERLLVEYNLRVEHFGVEKRQLKDELIGLQTETRLAAAGPDDIASRKTGGEMRPGVPKARTARAAFDRAVPAIGTLDEAMREPAPVRAGLTRGSATKAFLPEERDLGSVAAETQAQAAAKMRQAIQKILQGVEADIEKAAVTTGKQMVLLAVRDALSDLENGMPIPVLVKILRETARDLKIMAQTRGYTEEHTRGITMLQGNLTRSVNQIKDIAVVGLRVPNAPSKVLKLNAVQGEQLLRRLLSGGMEGQIAYYGPQATPMGELVMWVGVSHRDDIFYVGLGGEIQPFNIKPGSLFVVSTDGRIGYLPAGMDTGDLILAGTPLDETPIALEVELYRLTAAPAQPANRPKGPAGPDDNTAKRYYRSPENERPRKSTSSAAPAVPAAVSQAPARSAEGRNENEPVPNSGIIRDQLTPAGVEMPVIPNTVVLIPGAPGYYLAIGAIGENGAYIRIEEQVGTGLTGISEMKLLAAKGAVVESYPKSVSVELVRIIEPGRAVVRVSGRAITSQVRQTDEAQTSLIVQSREPYDGVPIGIETRAVPAVAPQEAAQHPLITVISRADIKQFVLLDTRALGPEPVTLTGDEFTNLWQAINLSLHVNTVEVILPRSWGLTQPMKDALRDIRSRKGDIIRCEEYSGEEHLKALLLREGPNGVKREKIVLTDSSSSINIAGMAHADPGLFANIRVLNMTLLNNYKDMSTNEKTFAQARMVMTGWLTRLYKEGKTPEVGIVLANMLTGCVEVDETGITGFLKNITESQDESIRDSNAGARILKRIQYSLDHAISITAKIAEAMERIRLMVKELWSTA